MNSNINPDIFNKYVPTTVQYSGLGIGTLAAGSVGNAAYKMHQRSNAFREKYPDKPIAAVVPPSSNN